jgi:mannose-6-phosphate isomerase
MHAMKAYPDDNHKPEMALALSSFEALCGFCGPDELKEVLRYVPELYECVGAEAAAPLLSARHPDKEVGDAWCCELNHPS